MAGALPVEVEELIRRVEDALRDEWPDSRVIPLLLRVVEMLPVGHQAWRVAHHELAQRALPTNPWQAALYARRIVDSFADDDRGWGVFALAQSLMGHYQVAAQAYQRALELAPDDPGYAHNLGHLYDCAFDQPAEALPLLRRAHLQLPQNKDVTASYAHALARAGDPARAHELMVAIIRTGGSGEHHALYCWINELRDQALAQLRDADPDSCSPAPRRRLLRRRKTQSKQQ